MPHVPSWFNPNPNPQSLTIMPKCTSYVLDMHIWAYPSMNAWMCILVHAIPAWIWMNISYCMTILCQICIRMSIWNKLNFGYDYMHIHVLLKVIFGIFDIFGQHLCILWKCFCKSINIFQRLTPIQNIEHLIHVWKLYTCL